MSHPVMGMTTIAPPQSWRGNDGKIIPNSFPYVHLEVPETGSLFRFGFVLFRLKPCRFDLNSANSAKWFYCVETVL
jgi:hypothetical protein